MTKPNESNELLDAANYYLSLGWHLTFFNLGTKGPNGVAAIGWNTPRELVATPERAAQKMASGPMNIGLCHLPSGTISLDVDDEAWTRVIFDEFGIDYDDLMSKGMRIFSKPGRDKALFKAPPDLKLHKINWPKQKMEKPNDVFTIFELRAGPNQDVLPPSIHPDGHRYSWVAGQEPWSFDDLPEIPNDLLDFWRSFEEIKDQIQALCPWRNTNHLRPKMVKRVVSEDHNNLIGKYNRANDVRDLLEKYGYKQRGKRWLAPSSSTKIPGVVVFDEGKCFSHHGSDVLADGHAHDSFDLFVMFEHNGDINGALSEIAREFGVDRQSFGFAPDVVVNVNEVIRRAENRIKEVAKEAAKEAAKEVAKEVAKEAKETASVSIDHDYDFDEIPDDIKLFSSAGSCGGMLAEIQKQMLDTAPLPCPEVAAAASVTLLGTVFGRKFATETGLRTNTYHVAVAGTGAGKDHPRKMNKVILQRAGMFDFIGGEEIASGQGLLSSMTVCGNRLFQLDEYGLMLQAISNPKAGAHLVAIASNFMKLYSSAGSIISGAERADQKNHKRADIEYPCVNMLGTTTPQELFPAMSSAQVVNGYANRMLFWFAPKRRAKRRMDAGIPRVSDDVVEWIKAVRMMAIGMEGTAPDNPILVPFSDGAREALCKFEDEILEASDGMDANPHLSNLWARTWEQAAKMSLIVCLSRMPIGHIKAGIRPEISAEDVRWSICAVRHLTQKMAVIVGARVADTNFEALCKGAMRVIEKAGRHGLTEREIGRAYHPFSGLDPVGRDKVFAILKRDERVLFFVFAPPSGRGRPRKAWVASKFEDQIMSNNVDGSSDA